MAAVVSLNCVSTWAHPLVLDGSLKLAAGAGNIIPDDTPYVVLSPRADYLDNPGALNVAT